MTSDVHLCNMSLQARLRKITSSLPEGIVLVAVSKTHSVEAVREAYEAGQRDFGENKVQELSDKQGRLPLDIRWHMIGHLQRNKVKYIVPFVHLIHSVDSLRLLVEIDKRAKSHGRVVQCLLQVHISGEETKFGFDEDEILSLLSSEEFASMENIVVRGLMGMATFTNDETQIRGEFQTLRRLFNKVEREPIKRNLRPEVLSMGMSSDYHIALECGSNMVRIGSDIFGERNYDQ